MAKTALVLRHVHFEDLGSFAEPLEDAGYSIRYSDLAGKDFCRGNPLEPDLLIILDGPIGLYEVSTYPFISDERIFIETRVTAERPTLGVCLGAQLIASALGGKVFSSGLKEIGFSFLELTVAGQTSPLRHLEGVAALHWHGDTYSLPEGATNLASTRLMSQQAFSKGPNILGLQFHLEAETTSTFDRWLVGHAAELAHAGIDIAQLRQDGRKHGPQLRKVAMLVLKDWLAQIWVEE